MEKWLDAKGLEGRYEVSNYGRLRNKITGNIRNVKPHKSNTAAGTPKVGYMRTPIVSNRMIRIYYLHRMVMEAFCPVEGLEKLHVNHKDFDTTNNMLENLEWVTPKENMRYSRDNGRYKNKDAAHSEYLKKLTKEGKNHLIIANTGRIGEIASGSKLKNVDIPEIRKLINDGISQEAIGKIFCVCHQTISNINKGKTWGHIK